MKVIFTYNGGRVVELSETDYKNNKAYWDSQPAIKTFKN